MQQTKITKTLGEFQNFPDNDNKTGLCLEDTLKFFEIQRTFGHFECIKQRGIKVTLIMTFLLVMLFYRSRNIHSYFSRYFGKYRVTDMGFIKSIMALIFDDTVIEKSGKKIEGVSKVHDHITGKLKSLGKESGVTLKKARQAESEKQLKKDRHPESPGCQRKHK